MAYLAANRSSSTALPQAPGKPQGQQAQQAQQAGLQQLSPDMLLRVKQLYSAFQSIVRVIQQVAISPSINQSSNQSIHASCLWAFGAHQRMSIGSDWEVNPTLQHEMLRTM